MAEKLSHSEIPLGSEWLFFGQDFGAKTDDLRQFDALNNPNVQVVPGVCVGASYFREFMEQNGFSEETPDDKLLRVKTKIPPSLKDVEKSVLAMVPVGSTFVVRSSAIGEHGGTGIYGGDVIVRTGDTQKDLENFGRLIKHVYSSYNRDNARIYREKRGQPYDGIALLIQPLVADVYKDTSSYPLLSGVMTVINGSPTLRLVQGLGVGAVEMENAIVLKRDEIQRDRIETGLEYLHEEGKMWTWNAARYEYDTVSFSDLDPERQERFVTALPKLERYLNVWRDLAEHGQPLYQEFAILDHEDKPVVLQSAPLGLNSLEDAEVSAPEGKIVCEGEDVVGQGIREGRGILWVGKNGFSPTDVARLLDWNRRNKNYLLILPDKVFSRVGSTRVELRHFSNASGVVELQYEPEKLPPGVLHFGRVDHTHKRGGAHFTELCGQVNILFLGSERKRYKDDLTEILGDGYQDIGEFSAFWDIPFKMVNGENEGWVEVVGKVEKSSYSQRQIKSWADLFWQLSHNYRDGDAVLESTCYTLCYFLADFLHEGDTGFNPVRIDQLSTEKQDELLDAIPNLRKVMETEGEYGYAVEEYVDPDLEKYFDSIKTLLVQALANRQN